MINIKICSRYLLFGLLLLSPFLSRSQEVSYGAYGLFPQGSGRAMAMGGAYTAISDDVFGMIYNPGGLGFGKWKADVGGTVNNVTNREYALFGSSDNYGIPYDFIFGGAGVRMGTWVAGIGVSSPYNLEYESTLTGNLKRTKLSIISADLVIAKKINDKVSVGIAGHSEKLTQSYHEETISQTYDAEGEGTGFYPSFGISFRGTKGGFGISYYPTRRLEMDETLNSQIGTSTWFRDVVIPGKTSFGVSYKVGSDKLIAIDFDKIEAVTGAVAVGSSSTGGSNVDIIPKTQNILHGGLEWMISKSKSNSLIFRLGGYKEPARVEGALGRTHFTFGLEVGFGPAILNVAFDQAANFTNTAQGFSLSFGNI